MSSEQDLTKDPRLKAGLEFLRRTGAAAVLLGFTDEECPPLVWYVRVEYSVLEGKPVKPGTEGCEIVYEAEAAMDPLSAVLRLCERMGDGAECAHCGKPSGFDPERIAGPMPLDEYVCWYQYDPGAKRFIRGCTS